MGNMQNKEYYNDIYVNTDHYSFHYKKSEYYKLWSEVLNLIDGSVFEIGCGTGQFAHMLHDNNIKEYVGVDFSDKAIDIANKMRKKYNLNTMCFVCGNIFDNKTYIGEYDYIIALEKSEQWQEISAGVAFCAA